MVKTTEIADWQKRFFSGPSVWVVEDSDGIIQLYENEEAAMLELAWHKSKGRKGYSVRRVPVCSLELARERWGS